MMSAEQLHQAACRGKPAEWWTPQLPARGRRRTHADNIDAWRHAGRIGIAICDTCPVKAACLAEAANSYEAAAIRGGLTPPELAILRRKRFAPCQP